MGEPKVDPGFYSRATAKFPDLPPRAACVAYWIEKYCRHTKGKLRGKPFKLIPWQLEALAGIYPGEPYEQRVITRAMLSMGRKNGKTEFCSCLVLVHLAGPEAGYNIEVVCAAAANKDQASLVWKGSVNMVKLNPALTKHFDCLADRLIYKPGIRDNVAFPISTKQSGAQGLRPDLFVYDEIAESKERGLWDSLDLAQTEEEIGGLGIVISTRSTIADSMFNVLDDEISTLKATGEGDHWYRRIWSADPKADNVFTWDQVVQANPAMGFFLAESILRKALTTAQRSTSARPGFRAWRLNIDSGGEASLVDPNVWRSAALTSLEPRAALYERMKGKRVALGLDLGSTRSMTALALYWPDERLLSVCSWMAKSRVEDNELLHRGNKYGLWAETGRLLLAESEYDGGMTYEPIAEHIIRCFEDFEVVAFRYDGWDFKRMAAILKAKGMDPERRPLAKVLDPFAQNAKDQHEAITEFEDMMDAVPPRMQHDNDPVTNSAVAFCQVEEVPTPGSPKKRLVKNKSKYPNDAAVSMIMAISDRGAFAEKKKRIGADDTAEIFAA